MKFESRNRDFSKPIEFADNIFWCGFVDEASHLHCNPYLIAEGNEAVVIDGGSRPDFSEVMLKILQTGTKPSQIKRLIYHHYDPDLCGSIPHFEEVIDNPELTIITDADSKVFIKYYNVTSPIETIKKMDFKWRFSSGRTLRFYPVPYAHSAGNFISYDEKTQTLFTSDLFGSYDTEWEFYLDIDDHCKECKIEQTCPRQKQNCPMAGIINFHKSVIPCNKALQMALSTIRKIPFKRIASQHGGIIPTREKAMIVLEKLEALTDVGIDGIKNE